MGLQARCHVSFLLCNLMEIYAHRNPLDLASVFVRHGLRRQPGGTDGSAAATHPPATSTVASTYGIFTSRATLDAFIAQISLQLQITLIKNTHAVAA